MATIVTRATKGSALTWTEGDANIENLNNDKIELTDLSVSTGAASGGGSLTYSNTTGEFSFAPADLSSIPTDVNQLTDTTNLLFDGAYSSLTGTPTIPTDTSDLTNGAGFITDYTVTENDVTTHQAALSITESQISDFGTYLTDITSESIGDLSNVDLTNVADGYVLVWDNANSKFVASAASGGASALNELTDVDLTSQADGYVLTYNSTSMKWEATDPNTTTGGTTITGTVTDIDADRNPNTITLSNYAGISNGDTITFSGSDVSSAGLVISTPYYIWADIGGGAFEISSDNTTTSTLTDFAGSRTAVTTTAQGNIQVDTADSKFGGASALFDGTGDYISLSPYDDFNFGSNDFTIELWFKTPATGTYQTLMSQGWNFSNTNKSFWLHIDTSNKVTFRFYDGAADVNLVSSSTISTYNWYHIAIVGNSSTIKLYLNGTEQSSVTRSNIASTTYNSFIGSMDTVYNSFNGWIDEFRISNTARYLSNFSPASVEFVDDSNTTLLLHMNGSDGSTTFTDDNSYSGSITDFQYSVTPAGGGGSGSVSSLNDLSDVSASAPTSGSTLIYNTASGMWESQVVSSPNLSTLPDVNAVSPSDGDILTYSTSTNQWTSGAPSSGGNYPTTEFAITGWTSNTSYKIGSYYLTYQYKQYDNIGITYVDPYSLFTLPAGTYRITGSGTMFSGSDIHLHNASGTALNQYNLCKSANYTGRSPASTFLNVYNIIGSGDAANDIVLASPTQVRFGTTSSASYQTVVGTVKIIKIA